MDHSNQFASAWRGATSSGSRRTVPVPGTDERDCPRRCDSKVNASRRHDHGRSALLGILVSVLCSLLFNADVLAFSYPIHYQTQGITSLIFDVESGKLFCGTKRGRVEVYRWAEEPHILQRQRGLQNETANPFPVFSMIFRDGSEGDTQLFCGGGDRYVSMWTPHNNDEGYNAWKCVQKLGPHTGWVKGLLYNPTCDCLFSLGCNCVETWGRRSGSSSAFSLAHLGRRVIASSPALGSTLSSDLLCLCRGPDDEFFYASGVDGRIHLWSSDYSVADPVVSVGAHSGRVNVLLYAPISRLLFSAGHDGVLQCRSISTDGTLLPSECCCICDFVSNLPTNSEEVRWTAASCVMDTPNEVDLVVGSAKGDIIHVHVIRSTDDSISYQVIPLATLDESPSVHAVCALPGRSTPISESSAFIAVGHALGLSVLSTRK